MGRLQMIKVLIVDDERLVVENITESIQWESTFDVHLVIICMALNSYIITICKRNVQNCFPDY